MSGFVCACVQLDILASVNAVEFYLVIGSRFLCQALPSHHKHNCTTFARGLYKACLWASITSDTIKHVEKTRHWRLIQVSKCWKGFFFLLDSRFKITLLSLCKDAKQNLVHYLKQTFQYTDFVTHDSCNSTPVVMSGISFQSERSVQQQIFHFNLCTTFCLRLFVLFVLDFTQQSSL